MLIVLIISASLLAILLLIRLFIIFSPQFGARAKGEHLKAICKSSNYKNGKFRNILPTTLAAPGSSMIKNGLKFMKTVPGQSPERPIDTIKFNKDAFTLNDKKLKATWFGHSTMILNIDGAIVLTDPVFSKSASPFSFAGVKSFEYSNTFGIEDLPEIDVVLISHDHYDHLDYKSILKLKRKVSRFLVPLGVSAHLIRWGVQKERILELDWNQGSKVIPGLEIIATPSRHFSGRAGFDRDRTLWCSWVIKSKSKNVFFCGDSGYGNHFKKIGDEHGPFDLTMMECGQYNEGWPFIHMNPEESVRAHIDLNGFAMLPIHWGKFRLSLHSWTEPIERAKKEAERLNVNLLNPIPGEIFVPVPIEKRQAI